MRVPKKPDKIICTDGNKDTCHLHTWSDLGKCPRNWDTMNIFSKKYMVIWDTLLFYFFYLFRNAEVYAKIISV